MTWRASEDWLRNGYSASTISVRSAQDEKAFCASRPTPAAARVLTRGSVRDVGVSVGEVLEGFLVHGGQDAFVDGRDASLPLGEERVEVLHVQDVALRTETRTNETRGGKWM